MGGWGGGGAQRHFSRVKKDGRCSRRACTRGKNPLAMFKSTVSLDVPGHPPGASVVRLPLLPVPSLHLRAAGAVLPARRKFSRIAKKRSIYNENYRRHICGRIFVLNFLYNSIHKEVFFKSLFWFFKSFSNIVRQYSLWCSFFVILLGFS